METKSMNTLTALQKEARERMRIRVPEAGKSIPTEDVLNEIDTLTRKAFISGIEAARGAKPIERKIEPIEWPESEGDSAEFDQKIRVNAFNHALAVWDAKLDTLLASLTEV
jgi:hypothetical protein